MRNPNPTAVNGSFEVELNNWSIGDYGDFMEAVRTNDVHAMHVKVKQVMLSWPYAGDPQNYDDFRALPLKEYSVIMKAINSVMSKVFSEGN